MSEPGKTPRIFVSMGTPYTEKYKVFRDALEMMLRDRCGVDARIIGKNEYPAGSPVHKIRDVMSTCDGVLVVAYQRKLVSVGLEKPQGKDEKQLENAKYTTPWNHVESAMAFSMNLPLYIICETGLVEEALIESKVDWYVQYMDFEAEEVNATRVVESLRSWVTDRVIPHARKPRSLISRFVKLSLSEMTGEEWAVMLTILGAVFGIGVLFGHLLPNIFH